VPADRGPVRGALARWTIGQLDEEAAMLATTAA